MKDISTAARSEYWRLALCGALLVSGCGGEESDTGGSRPGTVTDTWSAFCTATFTEDTPIADSFDHPLFTARAGESYLMSDFSSASGRGAALLYLTDLGPYEFEVVPENPGEQPFTTACPADVAAPYYAVFADTAVYAEEELTTKLCDLQAGTALPRDLGRAAGYSSAGAFVFTGPSVYAIRLNVLSSVCGGAELGYVAVPSTEIFDFTTWLVPIASIIGPD